MRSPIDLKGLLKVGWIRSFYGAHYQRTGQTRPTITSLCKVFWTAVIERIHSLMRGPRLFGVTWPLLPIPFILALVGGIAWLKSGSPGPTLVAGLIALYLYACVPAAMSLLDRNHVVTNRHPWRYNIWHNAKYVFVSWPALVAAPTLVVIGGFVCIALAFLGVIIGTAQIFPRFLNRLHVFELETAYDDVYHTRNVIFSWCAVVGLVLSFLGFGAATIVGGWLPFIPMVFMFIFLGLVMAIVMQYEPYDHVRYIGANVDQAMKQRILEADNNDARKVRNVYRSLLMQDLGSKLRGAHHLDDGSKAIAEAAYQIKKAEPKEHLSWWRQIWAVIKLLKSRACPIVLDEELIDD